MTQPVCAERKDWAAGMTASSALMVSLIIGLANFGFAPSLRHEFGGDGERVINPRPGWIAFACPNHEKLV